GSGGSVAASRGKRTEWSTAFAIIWPIDVDTRHGGAAAFSGAYPGTRTSKSVRGSSGALSSRALVGFMTEIAIATSTRSVESPAIDVTRPPTTTFVPAGKLLKRIS